MDAASSKALSALLRDAGYEVLVRQDGWCECFVRLAAERFIGRGVSEDEAIADAISQLLPSHLARVLLDRYLAVPAAEAAPIIESPASPAPETREQAPTADPPAGQPAPVAAVAAEPAPVELAEAHPAQEVAQPPAAEQLPVEPKVAPRRAVEQVVAKPRPAEALDQVEKMLTGIEDRLGSLARMCADRQRLNMLVWICRARAVEESMPGVRDVEHAVARVARRLTEIGKMFWPGSVRALQLSARPADVRREMHATWASEPSNWIEATSLAERLLAEHLQKSVDAGLDEDGWADGALRTPKPPDPDALFEEVDNELKTMLVPPGEVPNGRLGELTPAELDALVAAGRRLRWLRGAVKDELNWGIAMGRLRRALPGLGDRAGRVKDVLDNRWKPSAPWAKILGERDAEAPESEVTESPAKLLADLPAAHESKDALMAWLIRAFDVMNTPELVPHMHDLRPMFATFTEEELNHPDRRVRRRLRDLVKRVAESAAPPPKEVAKEPEAEDNTPDEPTAHALDVLSARVRAHTTGRRALFVSNREDPELGARLADLLGITITWCDGSLRRVQAQCERIGRGSYDLVLSATGFQVHGVDSALARASSAAGIAYVRVNRGRPAACVQAIAREFGLLSEDRYRTAAPAKASSSGV